MLIRLKSGGLRKLVFKNPFDEFKFSFLNIPNSEGTLGVFLGTTSKGNATGPKSSVIASVFTNEYNDHHFKLMKRVYHVHH